MTPLLAWFGHWDSCHEHPWLHSWGNGSSSKVVMAAAAARKKRRTFTVIIQVSLPSLKQCSTHHTVKPRGLRKWMPRWWPVYRIFSFSTSKTGKPGSAAAAFEFHVSRPFYILSLLCRYMLQHAGMIWIRLKWEKRRISSYTDVGWCWSSFIVLSDDAFFRLI